MITNQDIALWSIDHPWQSADQIEQDLLLSQAICVIAKDPLLGTELVLRGGTAYHKLFLPQPYRYSEDLDYVRTTSGGIGDVMKRLTALGEELGYKVSTKMGMYPKVIWRFEHASGTPGKIKIEINTFERSPMLPLKTIAHVVESGYCSENAEVPTFQVEELVATKLRAIYQRSKGRDLYDLWLALTNLSILPETIISAFPAYRPEGVTSEMMIENLKRKLSDKQFLHDMDPLIRQGAPAYDPLEAGRLVVEKLFSQLDEK